MTTHLGVAAKLGHLLVIEKRARDLDDVFTFLWCLFHFTCEKQASGSHYPSVKVLEALHHEETMEEHYPGCHGVITTWGVKENIQLKLSIVFWA